jgi:hypothetical protein
MNTRRYPRSAAEAFRGADWAGSITTPSGRVIGYQPAPVANPRRSSLVARHRAHRCAVRRAVASLVVWVARRVIVRKDVTK